MYYNEETQVTYYAPSLAYLFLYLSLLSFSDRSSLGNTQLALYAQPFYYYRNNINSFKKRFLTSKRKSINKRKDGKIRLYLYNLGANFVENEQSNNNKYNFCMSAKGGVTISQDDLIRMKMRANLIPNSDAQQNRTAFQYKESLKRTDLWSDNVKDLKKRKQEQRFRKFQKEELERRKLDEQEQVYQKLLKEEQLARANAKLFQNTEKVRALNSKLLQSDALKGREEQIEMKKYLKEIEVEREQAHHQKIINQIKLAQQQEQRKKQEEKEKMKKFQINLKKQNKQVIKQHINKYKEDMEEGQLIKLKAEQAIQLQQDKERERRQRNMQNQKQVNEINQKNKQLVQQQLLKEKQELVRIEQYRKKQQHRQDITKKRQQDLINEKIKQRQQLYEKQSFKLSQIKNNQVERLGSQIEELEKKQEQIERKKAEEKKILKSQYEESLKDQVQRRKREKEAEAQQNKKFKQTWKDKLTNLKEKQQNEEKYRKNVYNKNAEDLKRQMSEKMSKKQESYRKQLYEAQQAKSALENQDKQFKSYAQKCLKQWQSNGKNLYPIIKQLTATMKQA